VEDNRLFILELADKGWKHRIEGTRGKVFRALDMTADKVWTTKGLAA